MLLSLCSGLLLLWVPLNWEFSTHGEEGVRPRWLIYHPFRVCFICYFTSYWYRSCYFFFFFSHFFCLLFLCIWKVCELNLAADTVDLWKNIVLVIDHEDFGIVIWNFCVQMIGEFQFFHCLVSRLHRFIDSCIISFPSW
jgi:hypothetical protein